MGSVHRATECPNCKSKLCHHEHWYKSGEEEIWCFECGYQKSVRYKEDENSKYVLHDPAMGFSLDNVVVELFSTDHPYGVALIDYNTDKAGEIILLATEDAFIKNVHVALNSVEKENIRKITLSQFINGQLTKTVIYERNEKDGGNRKIEHSSCLSNGDY